MTTLSSLPLNEWEELVEDAERKMLQRNHSPQVEGCWCGHEVRMHPLTGEESVLLVYACDACIYEVIRGRA